MRTFVASVLTIGCLCGAIFLTSLRAQKLDIPDVSGHYNVEGEGSKGHYAGCVEIAQKDAAVYVRFFTEDDPNEPSSQGFGLIKDGYLVWGFVVAPGIGMGSLYKINGDTITGSYIEPDGTVYPETWVKGEHKDAPKGPRSVALLTEPGK